MYSENTSVFLDENGNWKSQEVYIDGSFVSENINKYPKSYWANTSSNSIVKSLIERADDITKGEIEALIEGKTI